MNKYQFPDCEAFAAFYASERRNVLGYITLFDRVSCARAMPLYIYVYF